MGMFFKHPDYTVMKELGRGASGSVYLAVQNRLNRRVAVKVLADADTENNRQRFLREAHILAQLDHPNIVSVYELAELQEQPGYLLAMAYVDGGTLRDRTNRMSLQQALTVVREIAMALGYAHQSGFIHRDVKPDNILFQHDKAMLADFGIARLTESQTQMTQHGSLLGTPTYMSPEQINGETLDSRTDLYSLGIVFFELLCGSPPFKADSAIATGLQHLTRPPPALSAAFSCYQSFMTRVLAKDKTNRPATAEDFLSELEAATRAFPWSLDEEISWLRQDESPRQRTTASGDKKSTDIKRTITAGILAMLLLSGFLLYQANRTPDDSDQIIAENPRAPVDNTVGTDSSREPVTGDDTIQLVPPPVSELETTFSMETVESAVSTATQTDTLQTKMRAALEQMQAGNWYSDENSAVVLYREILQSDPDNIEAINALQNVVGNTRHSTEQQISSGQLDSAGETLSILEQRWPEYPGLADLTAQYQSARQNEQDRKRAQAEKLAAERAEADRIRSLRNSALAAESAGRLILPLNNNALSFYRSIIEQSPSDVNSATSIDRIKQSVVSEINQLIDRESLRQAERLFNAFEREFPGDPVISLIASSLAKQQQITERRVEEQRRRESEARNLAVRIGELENDVNQWLELPSAGAMESYPQLTQRLKFLLQQSPQNATLEQLDEQSTAHYSKIVSTLKNPEDDTTDDIFRMPGF